MRGHGRPFKGVDGVVSGVRARPAARGGLSGSGAAYVDGSARELEVVEVGGAFFAVADVGAQAGVADRRPGRSRGRGASAEEWMHCSPFGKRHCGGPEVSRTMSSGDRQEGRGPQRLRASGAGVRRRRGRRRGSRGPRGQGRDVVGGERAVVEADDAEVAGDGAAGPVRGVEDAEGEVVVAAEDRGDVRVGDQFGRGLGRGADRPARVDDLGRVDPGFGQRRRTSRPGGWPWTGWRGSGPSRGPWTAGTWWRGRRRCGRRARRASRSAVVLDAEVLAAGGDDARPAGVFWSACMAPGGGLVVGDDDGGCAVVREPGEDVAPRCRSASGSRTEMRTVKPAALAASSMPRRVSAVPYREVSVVRTVTDRTAPPARVRADRLGR